MSKFAKFLSILLLVVALTPAAEAHYYQADSKPIRIKSAVVESEASRVVGQVEVCNSEPERVRFLLDVKNTTINHIYKRKLSVGGNDCSTINLRFDKDFAEMSNVGDEITMVAKRVRGLVSREEYMLSKAYETEVEKGSRDSAECKDQVVEDGIYKSCENAFIYHEPSGLRVKVVDVDQRYVDLELTHVEWGGVKTMRVYKGRSKKIRSNYDELERVEITNVYGEGGYDLYLKLES